MLNHDILRQITETTYTEIENNILIKISIPLIEKEEYTLHKPYLIPFRTRTGYQTYITEYIAVDQDNMKSIELHTQDLTTGKSITDHLSTDLILLPHIQPILLNPNSHCLSNLFMNPLSNKSTCTTINSQPINIFIKLSSTNSWLYSLTKTTDMIIKCKQNTTNLNLKGEGLLTFFTRCKITTKEFSVEVAGNPTTVLLEQPPTQTNPEEYQINFDSEENNENTSPQVKLIDHKTHNQDFIKENIKINELKTLAKNTILTKNRNFFNDNTNLILTIIPTILILTILVTIFILKTKKNPTKLTLNHINIQDEPKPKIAQNSSNIRII